MRRKVMTFAAIVAVAGGSVTACSSDPGTAGSSGSEITLIMSNHPWQRAIQPHLAEFTKETGIKVNVQTFAEQQMRDKIQLNLKSRSSAMDVFMTLPSREGPQFETSGYYEPLDSYFSASKAEYKPEDFSQGAMAGMKVNGKTVSVPINVEGSALFYRTDLFEKYNLTPPKTLDELESVSKAIKAKGEVTPIALRGVSMAMAYTFAPFLHSVGGDWTKDKTTPSMETPQAIEAIQRYTTLAKEYGPPGIINNTFTQSSALMGQGKVAMELESTNELLSITDPKSSKVADKIGVMDFPAGAAGSKPTVLSWALAISKFSTHKEAAWKFLQWATGAKVQLELTKEGIAPPRKSVMNDPAYTATLDTPVKKQWNQVLAAIQETGSAEVGPVGVQAPAMRQVVGDAIGKVILDQQSAAAAGKEIQAGLTPILASSGK